MIQNMKFDMTYLSNISNRFRRFSRRVLIALALLMAGVSGVRAQNYYVFYNATYGYITNNNGTLGVSNDFTANSVWIASGALNGTNSRSLQSYMNTSQYIVDTNEGIPTLGNAENRWRINNNLLYARWNSNYYIKYTGSAFDTNSTNTSGNTFTAYTVTITNLRPSSEVSNLRCTSLWRQ